MLGDTKPRPLEQARLFLKEDKMFRNNLVLFLLENAHSSICSHFPTG